ncbi:MAG: DegV family protein [Metamycoplasmataceae bacterium]
MNKIAVVIDSFSGETEISLKSCNENIYFLPLQVIVDEKSYQEGQENLDFVVDKLKFKEGCDLKTSLPSLDLVEKLLGKLSKQYENIIFLCLNSNLSSTFSTLKTFSQKYDNVLIYDNHFVGKNYLKIATKIIEMKDSGKNLKEIINFLDDYSEKSIGYIIPSEVSAFASSGRLKGIKKYISSKFFLIIKIFKGISLSGISRTNKGAIKKIIEKFQKIISSIEPGKKLSDYCFSIVYAFDETTLNFLLNELKQMGIRVDSVIQSSISVLIHTGYGAIYLGISPKL